MANIIASLIASRGNSSTSVKRGLCIHTQCRVEVRVSGEYTKHMTHEMDMTLWRTEWNYQHIWDCVLNNTNLRQSINFLTH